MTTLVGGVGELWQGDLDVGRRAVDALTAEDLGHGVLVEELHYGAVAVVQRLQEMAPQTLVLVGAAVRGRPPATLERRRLDPADLPVPQLQAAVADAVTGYVGIDLVVEVASGLGALPPRTVAVEVEPATTAGEHLSDEVAAVLPRLLELVRAEVRRAPLLELAADVAAALEEAAVEPSPAGTAMAALLRELVGLDRRGDWGAAFRAREQVVACIAAGQTGEGMSHVDWALWWTLLEELDRLAVDELGWSAPR